MSDEFTCSVSASPLAACERSEYEALLGACPQKTIFDTWPWVHGSYVALREDETPVFVTCRDRQGRLVGCLPLKLTTEVFLGLKLRTLRLVQYPLGDQMSIIADPSVPQAADALFGYLSGLRGLFDFVCLDEIRRGSNSTRQSFETPQTGSPARWYCSVQRETPVAPLTGKTRQTLQAGYPKSLKRRLKRCRNKIAPYAPQVEFCVVEPERVTGLLQEIKSVEDESWKGSDGLGVFTDGERYDLMRNISQGLAAAGELVIGTIRIDGEIATYRYGFLLDGVFYDYNLAYRQKFANLGAGRLLLDEMILEAADRGLRAVDASRTSRDTTNLLAERDVVWVPHERWMYFAPTVPGALALAKFVLAKPLARFVRDRIIRRASARTLNIVSTLKRTPRTKRLAPQQDRTDTKNKAA